MRRAIEDWAERAVHKHIWAEVLSKGLRYESQMFNVLWILFDFNHVFLYEEIPGGLATIESVVRTILEERSSVSARALDDHIADFGYRYLYPVECLAIIPALYAENTPGRMTMLDLATGEISHSRAWPHPDVLRPGPRTCRSVTDCMKIPGSDHEYPQRFTDETMRESQLTRHDEWVSRELGPIRQQKLHAIDSAIPDAVARSSAPSLAQSRANVSGGKSLNPETAIVVAQYEAIERYQLVYPDPSDQLYYGSYETFKELALDPRDVFMTPEAAVEMSGKKKWSPTTAMYWTWARKSYGTSRALVPAQSIWFTARLQNEYICAANTTNGCAMGSSSTEAAIFAVLEAVERDAYLMMWYLRRTCGKIRPETVRCSVFQLLWAKAAHEFPDYRFHLLDLRADIKVPSVGVIATRFSGNGPKTLHAAASRFTVEQASVKALQDIVVELSHSTRARADAIKRHALLENPELVQGPSDHRALYYLDESFGKLSFFSFEAEPCLSAPDVNEESPIQMTHHYGLRDVLSILSDEIERAGVPVWLKNITHPFCAEAGMACVKVVAPGLCPLWFGQRRQVALTPRIRKLSAELTGRSLQSIHELNLELHPFS